MFHCPIIDKTVMVINVGMAIGTIAALIVIFIFKKTKLDKKIESIGKKKNVA